MPTARGVASHSVGLRQLLVVAVIVVLLPIVGSAQSSVSGVVLDQTGLPLPGVRIEVRSGSNVVTTTVSGADGTFSFPTPPFDAIVDAALDGFETAHVPHSRAQRIVLELAHATESTTVVASVMTSSGAAMETLGS